MVTHTSNHCHSGGRDQKDHSWRPVKQKSWRTPSQPIKDGHGDGPLSTQLCHEVQDFVLKTYGAGSWWFTPVILTTQEAEMKRIMVQNQPK
jgi:hypothetical protein